MGTNYYIIGSPKGEEIRPIWHIGKRSAAGLYCYDCEITLCRAGAEGVHYGEKWHDRCPNCNKEPVKQSLSNSAAGMELGFNKKITPTTGVSSACSFTFAMTFEQLVSKLQELFGEKDKEFDGDMKTIVNEYGEEFSYMEFLELIRDIPTSLRFRNVLGQEFS